MAEQTGKPSGEISASQHPLMAVKGVTASLPQFLLTPHTHSTNSCLTMFRVVTSYNSR